MQHSKAGSFAAFVSGGGDQGGYHNQQNHQRNQRVNVPNQRMMPARPCADPRCTPENAQVPVYFHDLETGKNFCFVCWDSKNSKKLGLALSLEEMERIGVTSFNGAPKVDPEEYERVMAKAKQMNTDDGIGPIENMDAEGTPEGSPKNGDAGDGANEGNASGVGASGNGQSEDVEMNGE